MQSFRGVRGEIDTLLIAGGSAVSPHPFAC